MLDKLRQKVNRHKQQLSIDKKVKAVVRNEHTIRMRKEASQIYSTQNIIKRAAGIDKNEYIEEMLFFVPKAKQPLLKRNPIMRVVAEQEAVPYGAVYAKMMYAKECYNISFVKFAKNRLFFNCTETKLKSITKKDAEKKEKIVNRISIITGWTIEKTLAELHRVNELYGIDAGTYIMEQMYNLSDDEIEAFAKKKETDKKHFINTAMEQSGLSKQEITYIKWKADILYGITNKYFLCFKFWELTEEQMNTYCSAADSRKLAVKYNKKGATSITQNKVTFNNVFKDYINRKFWMNRETTFESFKEFIHGLDKIFCKAIDLRQGKGMSVMDISSWNGKEEELYDKLIKESTTLYEECIVQHEEMAGFHPTSINGVRTVVLQRKGEEPEILLSFIRFGNHGSVVDNVGIADGLVVGVNVETGEIDTDGFDLNGNIYKAHPMTGKTFKGFKIPHWEEVVNVSKEAIKQVEELNYVGWDIAICEDKVSIIEGNTFPGFNLYQLVHSDTREGQRYKVLPYL